MANHPIEALMKTTMESLKDMIDVNTIVGNPVEAPDGTVIIPISKVSFGFASGGGEYKAKMKSEEDDADTSEKLPFGGGTGAGVSVQPVAFMVVGNGEMKLLSVDQNANMLDNIINSIPKLLDKAQGMCNKNNKNQGKKNSEEKKTEEE
ncbi:GerW family sporulation protein [Marinisporobacter balticus]|uniref:Sporulation protein YtfJ n=1 Tax=Marinisporobacter balticus TaxID=2018667 RepID=A0A4R2L0Q1_9FIRM|nr:GerW family sporulation protein [Marinisporobacter balticus]TCO79823.1 sporulation protein YtfJ [Marinisporobacter balticus]